MFLNWPVSVLNHFSLRRWRVTMVKETVRNIADYEEIRVLEIRNTKTRYRDMYV